MRAGHVHLAAALADRPAAPAPRRAAGGIEPRRFVARHVGRQSAPGQRGRRRGGGATGIAPGMPLADARALRPGSRRRRGRFRRPTPRRSARLARWCGRYSPWTAPCRARRRLARRHRLRPSPRRRGRADGGGGRAAGASSASPPAPPSPIAPAPPGRVARCGGARDRSRARGRRARGARRCCRWRRCGSRPRWRQTLARLGLRRIGDLYRHAARRRWCCASATTLAARLDQALGRAARAALAAAAAAAALGAPPLRRADRRADGHLRAATAALLDDAVPASRRRRRGRAPARAHALSRRRHAGRGRGSARRGRAASRAICCASSTSGSATIDPGLGIEDMVLAATLAESAGRRRSSRFDARRRRGRRRSRRARRSSRRASRRQGGAPAAAARKAIGPSARCASCAPLDARHRRQAVAARRGRCASCAGPSRSRRWRRCRTIRR